MLQTAEIFSTTDWQKGYQSLPTEQAYWIDDIEGEIPQGLSGTLFRNGPGLLDIKGDRYGHPFDGDGMICAITFTNDQSGHPKAHFANSYVKTPEYLAEQAAGKILYRGVFGTQKPGGLFQNIFNLKLKNIANTNVVYHADKLLALWEASRPYRLDPQTLATIGIENFDGKLTAGEVFTAHPKLDPQTGKLWAFGVDAGIKSTINIYSIDSLGTFTKEVSHKVPGFCFLHDFAFTPNYSIFAQNPVSFNPLPFVLGLQSAGTCIELKPNTPTKILLCGRDRQIITLETDPSFIFHHCNAYEQGDQIILDSVCYADYPKLEPGTDFREVNFDRVIPGQLWRFEINVRSQQVKSAIIAERSLEFPVVNPKYLGQPYQYAYIGTIAKESGNAPLQAILKVNVQTGQQEVHSFAPRGFIGEPIFVPHPDGINEDHGWLLVLVFDASQERSDVVILDAADITAPPLATLHLKHHVPYGLHGSFTDKTWI